MLDNAIDVSRFPLETQRQEAMAKRRIGLGVTRPRRCADLLQGQIRCRWTASSSSRPGFPPSAMPPIAHPWRWQRRKAPLPCSTATPISPARTSRPLPPDIFNAIAAHGIRNALLTSIAPTGTISLFAGNVSSGIEPVFAFAYGRKVLQADGSRGERPGGGFRGARLSRQVRRGCGAAGLFRQRPDPQAADHLAVQAAAQPFIDSAISKTINVPAGISFEDFAQVYQEAYDSGCKGCTTLPPQCGDRRGSVGFRGAQGRGSRRKRHRPGHEEISASRSCRCPCPSRVPAPSST